MSADSCQPITPSIQYHAAKLAIFSQTTKQNNNNFFKHTRIHLRQKFHPIKKNLPKPLPMSKKLLTFALPTPYGQ